MPVRIGKRTDNFLLDTGSTHTIFDSQLESLLGESLGKTWGLGGSQAEQYAWPKAYLGDMELRTNTPVLCLDLTHLRENTGQEFMGILGMDWLITRVFTIDPDEGTLTFPSKSKLPPPILSNGIPIIFHGRLPFVDASVSGLGTTEFLIDIGAATEGHLESMDFRRLILANKVNELCKIESVDIFGISSTGSGQIESLTIGEFLVKSPRFVKSTRGRRLLGQGFWSRYRVTFDMPNELIYLKPSQMFSHASVWNRSGLTLVRKKSGTIVEAVRVGTPAEALGIRVGDLIISIDGTVSESLTLWEIRRMFSETGSSHDLLINSGNHVSKKKLRITEWIPTMEARPQEEMGHH